MSFIDRLREHLESAAQKGELTAIYVDPGQPDAFIVGIAEKIGSEGFLFNMVSPKGGPDGYQPTQWEDVITFHADSEYLGRVAALRNQPTPDQPPHWFELPSDPKAALQYAKDHRLAVSVRDGLESYQGFVRDMGKDWIEINVVIESGQIDGHYLLDLDRLDRIRIGGRDELEMEHLHRLRYGGA
ncbi:hypothetical protein EON81_24590 [bacterium]|nr:MAG: hypothetical protein EON81_24590 [bacterium]